MLRIKLTWLWVPLGQILFGLWLFDCLPLKPPPWLTEGPAPYHDPIIAFPAMARVFYLGLLIVVSAGPIIWIDTYRMAIIDSYDPNFWRVGKNNIIKPHRCD